MSMHLAILSRRQLLWVERIAAVIAGLLWGCATAHWHSWPIGVVGLSCFFLGVVSGAAIADGRWAPE